MVPREVLGLQVFADKLHSGGFLSAMDIFAQKISIKCRTEEVAVGTTWKRRENDRGCSWRRTFCGNCPASQRNIHKRSGITMQITQFFAHLLICSSSNI
jgi:hypothetical protein